MPVSVFMIYMRIYDTLTLAHTRHVHTHAAHKHPQTPAHSHKHAHTRHVLTHATIQMHLHTHAVDRYVARVDN